MVKRLSSILAVAFTLALASPVSAELMTKKFDWAPVGGIQKIDMQLNDIAISEMRFDLGDTVAPIRVSSAKAVVRVDNNSQQDQQVGVAIAVFDAEGNLVAAGDGGNKVGDLNRGDRSEFTVHFSYVYRNLKTARSFLITLETQTKSGKSKWTPKPTPTS
ncbi:MAG: hypothetical protein LC796_05815 [Acidobacteria bacterium]|nr:hypothetical protein [Acidobacteriota bacterium]MCA1611227.1 hypothetical protein [Acidobacteriota bacterium]